MAKPLSLAFAIKLVPYKFRSFFSQTFLLLFSLMLVCSSVSAQSVNNEPSNSAILSKEALGQALYFDTNLSLNRTQSCATCHNPSQGFSDNRRFTSANLKHLDGIASLGDDQLSLGGRNAPSAAYANQIPPFHQLKNGEYVGGQFWDGRASTLSDQAKGPPLNPSEMGLPDVERVLTRIKENELYINAINKLYGENTLIDPAKTYDAISDAISHFEHTAFFSPFDSKYDRYLRGEYTLTQLEDLGMTLFFSKQFSNCNVCHQLRKSQLAKDETFSNYQYHNIGVPANQTLRAFRQTPQDIVDEGLYENPAVDDPKQRGKFKVPSLRNVAITGPYMHNGVFKDLRTVVAFYNKYNSRTSKNQTNPETGKRWAEPEIPENISLKELEIGPALKERHIDALVAFLKTLTDQRYE